MLIEKYKHLGDGTFLVRESDTFVGDYTLSFWLVKQIHIIFQLCKNVSVMVIGGGEGPIIVISIPNITGGDLAVSLKGFHKAAVP